MVTSDRLPESLRPASAEELAAMVREGGTLHAIGTARHRDFFLPAPQNVTTVTTAGINGIVAHYEADQVVVARAGTTLAQINEALGLSGQCIPYGEGVIPAEGSTLGGLISMNLPHTLEAQCGTWRDWILGLTAVLSDGTIAKGGSLAVKNVAGYDVQKLFIGARGVLGIVTEVVLRTFPTQAVPPPEVILGDGRAEGALWVQRVLHAHFEAAARTDRLIRADRATSTLLCAVPPDQTLPRFLHDWVIRSGCGQANLQFTDPVHVRLMQRAKALLDPLAKLNPGALGVI